MPSVLEVYRDFASSPERQLSVEDLTARGVTRNNAHVMLSRLRSSGLAVSVGKGKVRLLLPTESPPPKEREDPVVREVTQQGGKATGFSVLPQRYPGPRPREFVVPPGKAGKLAEFVKQHHAGVVVTSEYRPDERAVCLYAGKVRGKRATTEEALMHVFRHAPTRDFALALQAVLLETTTLNWHWLRRQPEWKEIAGIFAAVNSITERDVFPRFRDAELPRLSFDEIETIAQAVTARGFSSPG